jgi:hypothetical protein
MTNIPGTRNSGMSRQPSPSQQQQTQSMGSHARGRELPVPPQLLANPPPPNPPPHPQYNPSPAKQETDTAPAAAAAAEGEAPAAESEGAAAPEEAPVVRFILPWLLVRDFVRSRCRRSLAGFLSIDQTPLTLISILLFRRIHHQVQLAEVEVVTGEDDEVRKNDDQ